MFIDSAAISTVAGVKLFRERDSQERASADIIFGSIEDPPRARADEEKTGHLINIKA